MRVSINSQFVSSQSLFVGVLDRQIHANPPGRQSHTFLFIHAHAGVVSLKESGILSLRAEVGYSLSSSVSSSLLRRRRRSSKSVAEAGVKWGAGRGEDRPGRELSEDGPVEGAEVGG